MKVKDILQNAKIELKSSDISTADLDAEILVAKALNKERLQMLLDLDFNLTTHQAELVNEYIALRKTHMPISYITNEKDFWKDTFYVDNRVLIPRPDSETFIELALKYFPDRTKDIKVLDLGSGSGCLGISVLKEYQAGFCIFADSQTDALEVAIHNSITHKTNDRSAFVCTDWFSNIDDQDFDLILCNPPYIAHTESLMQEVIDFEPHTALFTEVNGTKSYSDISQDIDKHLKQGGIALFEIGYTQLEDVLAIFKSNTNLEYIEAVKDLNGVDRCLTFRCIKNIQV